MLHLVELAELGRQRAREAVDVEVLGLKRRGCGNYQLYHTAGVREWRRGYSTCAHGDERCSYHVLCHLVELAELGWQRARETVGVEVLGWRGEGVASVSDVI